MVPNQIPSTGEKLLDHIAHWVPDLDAASETLASLGFVLTPWSEQHAAPRPGAPTTPVGSANRCIMLRSGYLEILAPLAPTPIGRELQAGIDRYVGVHLLAFGSPDTKAEQARLEALGFPQRPVVALRREVESESGETATLRFTVGRAELGSMAEGRVQFLTHHTPEHLWQTRYLAHPNTVEDLAEIWVVVADLEEAAARYGAYLDFRPTGPSQGRRPSHCRGAGCRYSRRKRSGRGCRERPSPACRSSRATASPRANPVGRASWPNGPRGSRFKIRRRATPAPSPTALRQTFPQARAAHCCSPAPDACPAADGEMIRNGVLRTRPPAPT